MKKLVFALLALPAMSQAQVVFYGGDFDGVNGFFSFKDSTSNANDFWVFDDFSLGSSTVVAEVFCNALSQIVSNQFNWEIRTGINATSFGTLVASGAGTAIKTATGRSGFGLNEFQYRITGLNVNLGAGSYFLGMQQDAQNGTGLMGISTTAGGNVGPGTDPNPNPTGSPINNGNSWQFSTGTPNAPIAGDPQDFSYGVVAVPEPGTMIALVGGLAALAARRRRAR